MTSDHSSPSDRSIAVPYSRRALLRAGAALALGAAGGLAGARPAGAATHGGWRYCSKCRGLARLGNQAKGGVCPAGGRHANNHPGYRYVLHYDIPTHPDRYWNWWRCTKCLGLFVKGEGATACPAGGRHRAGTIEYGLWAGPIQAGQEGGWDECERCWSLVWANGSPTAGVCPLGGAHQPRGIFYKLDLV